MQRPNSSGPADAPAAAAARFEELWSEAAPAVCAWLEIHVRDALRPHLDPEDALQEVACRAFDGFGRFDSDAGPFRAWVFGIARNVLYRALSQLGRNLARPEVAGPRFDTQAWGRLPDTTTSITRRVVHNESLKRFVAQVRELDEDDRRLLLRRGLEGRAHEDIARELGISTDASIKRWTRLRDRLASAQPSISLAP
jgi:RNA polymerase sigma factor (sigma-70 family)